MKHCEITNITNLCVKITETKLEALRLEEELLLNLVKCSKIPMHVKKKAFERMEKINNNQLTILGAKIKNASQF